MNNTLTLNQIYEPVVVGTPPSNAFRSLIRLPDGSIRCYGYRGTHSDPSPIYLESTDSGLTWTEKLSQRFLGSSYKEETIATACSPYSGHFYHLEVNRGKLQLWRSETGIDGEFQVAELPYANVGGMIRLPVFLEKRKRVLVTGQIRVPVEHMQDAYRNHPAVFLSDDDGRTWRLRMLDSIGPFPASWPHRGLRWQQGAVEPTIAELTDGRLWMLTRTSADRLYESYSTDGGDTWSPLRPSRFHATVTMPTLHKLQDGRILLVWLNTVPLPERDHTALQPYPTIKNVPWWRDDLDWAAGVRAGRNEDVFTNRDAIHAAITEDDGISWRGFRELYLNPLRNDSDFAHSHGGPWVSLDKGVHQSQVMEVSPGKLLVALGQHPACRKLVMFDAEWLYETKRSDDFKHGLAAWSVHQYVDEIKGHLAYDRKQGAQLVPHPDVPGRHALHIQRKKQPGLVSDLQGAVWNFPACREGKLEFRLKPLTSSCGGWIGLADRWLNPSDPLAQSHAIYNFKWDVLERTGWPSIHAGKWNHIVLCWTCHPYEYCRLSVNGQPAGDIYARTPPNHGISYVIFQCPLEGEEENGYLIESVVASANEI